jgi:hypothetical protein
MRALCATFVTQNSALNPMNRSSLIVSKKKGTSRPQPSVSTAASCNYPHTLDGGKESEENEAFTAWYERWESAHLAYADYDLH